MEDQNEVFTLKLNQNKSLLSNNQSHPFTEKLTILKPKNLNEDIYKSTWDIPTGNTVNVRFYWGF